MPVAPPNVVIFLSNNGQDPTEAAMPWAVLKAAGCNITFATEHGDIAHADHVLLQRTLFATIFGASRKAKHTYGEMVASPEHRKPLSWTDTSFDILEYDIVILPGGHDKPIRQYLESGSLHRQLERFLPCTDRTFTTHPKVLGAICHGVLLLAFAHSVDGKSLLAEHRLRTTTLPMWMEATAWIASQAWLKGSYYRTYIERGGWCCGYVKEAGGIFIRGPINTKPFVHIDPNHRYISARFPGDAELWAQTILLEARATLGEW